MGIVTSCKTATSGSEITAKEQSHESAVGCTGVLVLGCAAAVVAAQPALSQAQRAAAERLDSCRRKRRRQRIRSRWTRRLLAAGKAIFKEKCQKCHGPGGKGDGPDADPDAQEDMDLTNPKRAARNTDGVVFYKVWNGRKKPKMPAQKDELTKEQIWVGRRLRADAAEDRPQP